MTFAELMVKHDATDEEAKACWDYLWTIRKGQADREFHETWPAAKLQAKVKVQLKEKKDENSVPRTKQRNV